VDPVELWGAEIREKAQKAIMRCTIEAKGRIRDTLTDSLEEKATGHRHT
jgi:hypothetical protein